MYHTHSLEKSAIAERLNRSLNNKLTILFEFKNNKKGVDFYNTYWMNTTLKTITYLSE